MENIASLESELNQAILDIDRLTVLRNKTKLIKHQDKSSNRLIELSLESIVSKYRNKLDMKNYSLEDDSSDNKSENDNKETSKKASIGDKIKGWINKIVEFVRNLVSKIVKFVQDQVYAAKGGKLGTSLERLIGLIINRKTPLKRLELPEAVFNKISYNRSVPQNHKPFIDDMFKSMKNYLSNNNFSKLVSASYKVVTGVANPYESEKLDQVVGDILMDEWVVPSKNFGPISKLLDSIKRYHSGYNVVRAMPNNKMVIFSSNYIAEKGYVPGYKIVDADSSDKVTSGPYVLRERNINDAIKEMRSMLELIKQNARFTERIIKMAEYSEAVKKNFEKVRADNIDDEDDAETFRVRLSSQISYTLSSQIAFITSFQNSLYDYIEAYVQVMHKQAGVRYMGDKEEAKREEEDAQ